MYNMSYSGQIWTKMKFGQQQTTTLNVLKFRKVALRPSD